MIKFSQPLALLLVFNFLLCSFTGSGSTPISVVSTSAQPGKTMTATGPVTYTLDDFDVANRYNNDFFSPRGIWNTSPSAVVTDAVICEQNFSCYLGLAYDLSAAGAKGGYWEKFAATRRDGAATLRDLSKFTQLRLRVRGDATVGFPSQFQIEFIGRSFDVPRALFTVSGVTAEWQWKTIPLSNAGTYDWSAMTQVSINLDGAQMTDKTGRLFFDDLSLVAADDGKSVLELTEQRAFLYFWENRDPETGFARDRASDPYYRNVSSIAVIGFELAAFGIGAQRGWISREEAAQAAYRVLNHLATSPQGPGASGFSGYRGFFYHLLVLDTGLRDGSSELSSVDTALLMTGVLFARQYFSGSSPTEVDIRRLAGQLYNRVEWDWMLRTDTAPADRKNQFYMGWKPERRDCSDTGYQDCYEIPDPENIGYFSGELGVTSTTWNYYTDEILLINILAIGSPTHPVTVDTMRAWKRETGTYAGYTFIQSSTGQLFTYFVGQLWMDRSTVKNIDPLHVDWWLNSQKAILANRQFAIDHAGQCKTYSALSWGISTSLNPPRSPNATGLEALGTYGDHPISPPGNPASITPDCTVAPYAVAASSSFLDANPAANVADQALEHWFTTQPRLWGLYGFKDAFNLDQGWYAHDYFGLDLGLSLLGLENHQTGLVWDTMQRDPVLRSWVKSTLYLPMTDKTWP